MKLVGTGVQPARQILKRDLQSLLPNRLLQVNAEHAAGYDMNTL
jgi:hypothetical protein